MTPNGKKINQYFKKKRLSRSLSDAQFDELLASMLQQVTPLSLERLSLDSSDTFKQSVWIKSPPRLNKLQGMEFQVKKGKDKTIRFTPIGITIYHFGHHSILAYQCTFDPTTENCLNEQTFEFFYNEIVSFETRTESGSALSLNKTERVLKKVPVVNSIFKLGKKIQFDKRLQFILTTSGGTRLAVALTDNVIRQQTDGGKFSLEASMRSVDVVRRTIRDKKSHTFHEIQRNRQ
ncbi:MAG: hypothetical protein AAGA64_12560 [Bacteroidota bacterium]